MILGVRTALSWVHVKLLEDLERHNQDNYIGEDIYRCHSEVRPWHIIAAFRELGRPGSGGLGATFESLFFAVSGTEGHE